MCVQGKDKVYGKAGCRWCLVFLPRPYTLSCTCLPVLFTMFKLAKKSRHFER